VLENLKENDKMTRRTAVLTLIALVGFVSMTHAEDKAIKATQDWKGTVADEMLQKKAPANGYITDAKTFKQLWEDWKLGDKMPVIDFKKEVVVVQTTRGSQLQVGPVKLTEKGDLRVVGIATLDLQPGFRYAVLVLPREGVKSVNGKELKD
jgi:hypothetical protein